MTISSTHQASSSSVSQWTLDADGCRVFLKLPNSRFEGVAVAEAWGWVELRETELVGSRISLRFPRGGTARDEQTGHAGCVFQGSAVRRGTEGEMVVEGRLSVGDRVDPLTLSVIPTRYHRSGDTEYLDLDVSGPMPSNRCGATRVEGRLRILRASPVA